MKRLLFIPLLALPLLFANCDGETPTEPATVTDASFDVTAQGLTTNTIQVKGWCASGYTGGVRFDINPIGTQTIDCPGGSFTVDATVATAMWVDYYDFNPAVPTDCTTSIRYSVRDGEVPAKDKCTVNGRNASGKPIAKTTMKYVK